MHWIQTRWVTYLALFLLQGCCKPDPFLDSPCGIGCRADQVCENGYCKCPDGNIDWYGTRGCFTITENTYYGKSDSCQCFTELMIEASRLTTSSNFYFVGWFPPEGGGGGSGNGEYYKKADGDSVFLYLFNLPACTINGVVCQSSFRGKFKGADTLDAWIIWFKMPYLFNEHVDSCHVVFVKPKL